MEKQIHSPNTIKLCFVLPHFRAGGLEQVILNLISHINRDIFTPALLLLNKEGQLLSHLPQDVQISHLNNAHASVATGSLITMLNKLNPDIVYTGTNATNLLVLLARRFTKTKFRTIISEHTPLTLLLNDSKWQSLRVILMRWLYRYSDLFAAPVPEICTEHKIKLRLPHLKTLALNNPVLSKQYDLAAECPDLMRNLKGPVFVAAGRLAAEKQFDFMIRCFAKLTTQHPTAELVILGEGEERTKLEDLIKEHKLEASVHLPGYVPDPHNYYKWCTAVLSSSRREGFGNVLVEALAQGVPVISTDCPFGPRNILENGENGILVQMDDATAFIKAMRQLIEDSTLRNHFIKRGKAAVEKYFIPCAVQQFEKACLDVANIDIVIEARQFSP